MVEADYEDGAESEPSVKPYRNPKAYLQRLKRHQDAVLALYSPDGIDGSLICSGSADEKLRVWDLRERTISKAIPFARPTDDRLMKYRNMAQDGLPNFSNPNLADQHFEEQKKVVGGRRPESQAGDHLYKEGPLQGLPKRMQHDFPTCLCFAGHLLFSGYEDGLICCWDIETGKFNFPMIGHTNRVNHMLASGNHQFIFSSANDCTVRKWDVLTGVCDNIFKFADPISVIRMKEDWNYMFTANWDKMVRVIDLDKQQTVKSFVASKETIKEMIVTDDTIVVAGCEPIIRSYNFTTGSTKTFMGHRGWVYCLLLYKGKLFSGGDDNMVRIWNMETATQLEALEAHRNGVTSIVMCSNMLITASFDHYIVTWDYPAMETRINEKQLMREEDIRSRKIEVYYRALDEKNQKRGGPKRAAAAGKKKKKK